MKDFKKLPKMACGGSVRKMSDGGSLASKSGFSNLVGRPTGKFSEAGKPIFRTSEGEDVSEKSTTLSHRGKFINTPSIIKGVQRSDDEIMNRLEKGRIKPTSTHDTVEDAVEAAKARSSGLIKNKRGGKVTKKK
jgi:DNA replication initiation complex subunit (GINS family)